MKLINRADNKSYIIDYYFADKAILIFTSFWVLHVVYSFYENSQRPNILFEPIIWIQKLYTPTDFVFYFISLITILLCLLKTTRKKILPRLILFFCVLWLNTIKWNYNVFPHVGHLLIVTHLTTIFIPSLAMNKSPIDIDIHAKALRWAQLGILSSYSLAGVWKFLGLFYKLIYFPNEMTWIHKNAIEVNAIANARLWDEIISDRMIELYQLPYIWEFCTVFIFVIQLVAIFAAFNKKITYFIIPSLILFHTYNILFINISFYTSIFVLLIIFFPYNKIMNYPYSYEFDKI